MRTRYTDKEEKELQQIEDQFEYYFKCTKYGTYLVVLLSIILAIYVNL